jgi:hypothetical protein
MALGLVALAGSYFLYRRLFDEDGGSSNETFDHDVVAAQAGAGAVVLPGGTTPPAPPTDSVRKQEFGKRIGGPGFDMREHPGLWQDVRDNFTHIDPELLRIDREERIARPQIPVADRYHESRYEREYMNDALRGRREPVYSPEREAVPRSTPGTHAAPFGMSDDRDYTAPAQQEEWRGRAQHWAQQDDSYAADAQPMPRAGDQRLEAFQSLVGVEELFQRGVFGAERDGHVDGAVQQEATVSGEVRDVYRAPVATGDSTTAGMQHRMPRVTLYAGSRQKLSRAVPPRQPVMTKVN